MIFQCISSLFARSCVGKGMNFIRVGVRELIRKKMQLKFKFLPFLPFFCSDTLTVWTILKTDVKPKKMSLSDMTVLYGITCMIRTRSFDISGIYIWHDKTFFWSLGLCCLVFTESAHRADSVIELQCPSVRLRVCPLPVKFILGPFAPTYKNRGSTFFWIFGFLREKLRKGKCLRFSNFCLEMV